MVFMTVRWDKVNGKAMTPRVMHQWDYSVFEGGGPYSSKITRIPKSVRYV